MKITVDTNVLVSATFWYGDSNKIIEMVENKKIVLILSRPILEEYVEVINSEDVQSKIKNKKLIFKYSTESLNALAEIINIKSKINIVKEDPDDNKILECAFDGRVDYIISKDNHLLKLKEFRGIKIIKPEEALVLF
ncbi:MAG: putative toxin-antitoxin system toxin component, PIN family [Nanoarchaeota archaeon]